MLAGLVPMLLLLWAAQYFLQAELKTEARAQMNDTLMIAENLVIKEHREHLIELSRLASSPELFTKRGEQGLSPTLANVEQIYKVFGREMSLITLFDKHGSPLESNTVYNVRNRQFTQAFQSAVSGTPYVVPPHRLEKKGPLHLAFYHPISHHAGEVGAVVRHYFPMQEITSGFEALFNTGEFILLDHTGRILSGVTGDDKLLKLFDTLYSEERSDRSEGKRVKRNNITYLKVSRKIPSIGDNQKDWELVHLLPESLALVRSTHAKRSILLIGGITLPLLCLLGYVVSDRLSRPIHTAALAASQLARGNYDVVLPEGRGFKETRLLAKAFASMTREVRRKKDFLEKEIEKRTNRLREASAYLTSSLDSIEDAIILVDADSSEIRYANEAAVDFFGEQATRHNSYAPLFAHHAGHYLNEEEGEQEWLDWWRAMSLGDFRGERKFLFNKDGVEGSMHVMSSGVNHAGSGKVGRLWLFRDITQSEKMENELLHSNKMEAIGRLAGGVAHDFNNILTTIQGSIEIAGSDLAKGRNPRKSLAIGMNACSQAAQVVQQLLTFSRNQPVRLKECSLDEILKETVELLQHGMDPKHSIYVDIEDEICPVMADPPQVHQVVMNLLINALQAMRDGGDINVRLQEATVTPEQCQDWPYARAGHYCVLTIEDEGIGMTDEIRARIFEPFFTTKEMDEGSGLGLSTTLGVVHHHKGWIDCRSTPGVGTVFDVYLPAATAGAEKKPTSQRIKPSQETVTGSLLIVDDDMSIRSLARAFLEGDGHQVEEAEDGLQALEKLSEENEGRPFDLIILDLSMPKLSGQETFEAIRTLEPDLPVLIWSGYSEDSAGLLHKDAKHKPNAFLHKPFLSGELKETVQKLLRAKLREQPTLVLDTRAEAR